MTTEVFKGGCLCGDIRYRSKQAPVRGVFCHCDQCKKHSGAPGLAFVHFPVESFEWLKEEPQRYRSSEFAERGFCARCGSTLSMHEEILKERVQICVGSLDKGHRVKIDDQVWTSSKLPWVDTLSEIHPFPKSSNAAPTKAKQNG